MYTGIKSSQNDEIVNVKGKKNIILTGLNGVGKSVLLKSMEEELLTGKITLKNKMEFKECKNFQIRDANTWRSFSEMEEIDLSFLSISPLRENLSHFSSVQVIRDLVARNYTLLNMNELIKKDIASGFSNIEKRMIGLYNKMQNITSQEIIKNNGAYLNKNIQEFGYVRAKRNLDAFLEDKTIDGINLTGDKLMILDRDGNQKHINGQLSSGEQVLFSIASLLLEIDNSNKILFWDEPEQGFSPSWQRKLIPFINSIAPDAQLIITTHSTHIISTNYDRPESIIVKVDRDSEGTHLSKANVFDDKDLMKDHSFKNNILKKIVGKSKTIVLVEGITDKIIFSNALGDAYEVIDCNGHVGVKHAVEVLPFYNPNLKLIAVTDNDVEPIKGNEVNIFGTNLLGLQKNQTIEKFFEEYIPPEYKHKFSDDIQRRTKKGDVPVTEEVYDDAIQNVGFLCDDKFKSKSGMVMSKVDFAKLVITKDGYKEKMLSILNFIESK